MKLDPRWEFVSDQVMGGVSRGNITVTEVDGQTVHRLTGSVSLENNGGFVQMAFDLAKDGSVVDASGFAGVALDVRGNAEPYDLRLRTTQLTRPWQSFRTSIVATRDWSTVRLPFADFEAHRTDAAFDPASLRRIGILGIGREFEADVSVRAIAFYD